MKSSKRSSDRQFRLPALFPLFLCSLFALSMPIRERLQPGPSPSPLPVEVRTGRSPHCSGRGLCHLQARQEGHATTPDASGLLSLTAEGKLQLKLSRTSMSPGLAEEQITDELFDMPASLPLPQTVREAFPDYPLDSIPTGRYRTMLTLDTLYVFFE